MNTIKEHENKRKTGKNVYWGQETDEQADEEKTEQLLWWEKKNETKTKWAVSGFSEAPVAPILLLRKRFSVSMHYVNLKNDIYLAIYAIDSKDWICATKTIKLISVVLQRSNKLIQYSKRQLRYEELESIIWWFKFISRFSSNEQQMILLLN